MNPILREYLLKGVFLGLWAYLALILPPPTPDWPRLGRILGFAVGGLVLGLIAGAIIQIRRGYRPGTNLKAFPLVVLLESPFWIYAGLVAGLAIGLVVEVNVDSVEPVTGWLAYFVIGGAVLGYGFQQLREVKDWAWRFGLAAIVGAALVYFAIYYLELLAGLSAVTAKQNFAFIVLAGLPFFYLLTFCGEAEESEVEIAAICAALGIGLYLLGIESGADLFAGKLIFFAPLIVYFVYVTRIMPGLRVFKHVLRGYSALNLGQHLPALISFKRALRLSPTNELATQGMWSLHQDVDVTKLASDSALLDHLDYDFCLTQAGSMLLGGQVPTVGQRQKAGQMLTLVERQAPMLAARVDYLRAVSQTHAKEFDAAAGTLSRLLDPETPYDTAKRNPVLFGAWDLATRLHPELVKRLGTNELAKPGRRMSAIAAVERQLATEPNDGAAQELKSMLYASLTESEFVADTASGLPEEFHYDYVEQLGFALVDNTEADNRERGMAFLRIAGRGLPGRGPTIFGKLADIATLHGQTAEAQGYFEQVKRCGVQVGPKALPEDQRAIYFSTLQTLAATAEARGDYDAAIGDLRLYLEGGRNEAESFRKMADLYEKNKDPLNALLMTETGLVYNGKDRDFLEKKDKYYYSVDVEKLKSVKDKVFRFFDVTYCTTKAKQILDQREADLGLIDWALHLSRLARVIKPDSAPVQLSEARCLLRKGENDAALHLLEDIREAKPSGSEDKEAWFQASKLVGDMYLNELNRPDLAVQCYLDYRDYSKSGADTLFHIARSYEAGGDTNKAISFYEQVTAYEQHPKYWDATEAIRRLKGQS